MEAMRCPEHGKIIWKTRARARQACEWTDNEKMHPYRCQTGHGWHIRHTMTLRPRKQLKMIGCFGEEEWAYGIHVPVGASRGM